ncbi:GTP 3',8-cyclase MoaA [Virgibacillus necropolis]|uniref:GTP 3',8-cyclase MoaA n=1 Tax=Virgibacillus necropolis TaxID=163877 RepID=UPI00384DDC01
MNRGSDHTITDKFNRPLRDLRISVIDRCNFRCTYCMPAEVFGSDYPFLKKQELLSFEEITRVAQSFAKLGVNKIRITGGEPLMRRDLEQLIQNLSCIPGIKDLAMTTNGSLLSKKAKQLKEAGLKRVTISLDSLDNEKFGRINGRGVKVDSVLNGIKAAQEVGLKVKVNMLVKRGVNEHEIIPMARLFQGTGTVLRFIEYMDVGNSNGWTFADVISKEDIINRLEEEMRLVPIEPDHYGEVATRYLNKDSGDEYGFISSISAPFCSSCTRARLSADGKIYTCLFAANGTDLHTPIRSGVSDDELNGIISQTWGNRTDRYSEERTPEKVAERNKQKIEMSYIGG